MTRGALGSYGTVQYFTNFIVRRLLEIELYLQVMLINCLIITLTLTTRLIFRQQYIFIPKYSRRIKKSHSRHSLRSNLFIVRFLHLHDVQLKP